MKAFGPPHANPDIELCPTPVGDKCIHCDEAIVEGDRGVLIGCSPEIHPSHEAPYHRECMLRSLFDSVGHQQKKCSCYGGTEEDPPEMTRREAAQAAVACSKTEMQS